MASADANKHGVDVVLINGITLDLVTISLILFIVGCAYGAFLAWTEAGRTMSNHPALMPATTTLGTLPVITALAIIDIESAIITTIFFVAMGAFFIARGVDTTKPLTPYLQETRPTPPTTRTRPTGDQT